jgi:hypothetical protein
MVIFNTIKVKGAEELQILPVLWRQDDQHGGLFGSNYISYQA